MSAFVVSKEHIDALVRIAYRGPRDSDGGAWGASRLSWLVGDPATLEDFCAARRVLDTTSARRVGQMLVAENVLSVCACYPDASDMLPDYVLREYEPELFAPLPSLVEALKLISCYEYQSCEHGGWRGSEARQFCCVLRAKLITSLPGYDAAPWEWVPERAHA